MAESRQVDISDSDESMSDESMADSQFSIFSHHEENRSDHGEKPFDNLLDCYALKSASNQLSEGAYRGIEFDTEEALLLEFLQHTKSLAIIQKVLQQNQELAKKLEDKINPEDEEEEEEEEEDECPNCGK